ncbi:MAG: MBG domain-containing protein [Clostridia bacterium]
MMKKLLTFILICSVVFGVVTLVDIATYASAETSPVVVKGAIQNVEKLYGDADPTFEIKDSLGNIVAYPIVFKRPLGEDSGEYEISVDKVATGSKYDCSAVTSGKLVIKARPLTLAVLSATKVYGDSEPTYEYGISSGFLQKGDVISDVKFSRANQSENIGSYDVNIESYKILNGTVDKTKNYTVSTISSTLTISKKELNLASESIIASYGDTVAPSILGGMISDINGNKVAIVFEKIDTLTLGTRPIKYSVEITKNGINTNDNFKIIAEFGTLTVNKRALTIIPQKGLTFVYGSDMPQIPYDTVGTLANGQQFKGSLSREFLTNPNVNVYNITKGNLAIFNGDIETTLNYEINLGAQQIEIKEKPLSIVFDNVVTVYGEGEYDFTVYNNLLQQQLCFDDGKDIKFVRAENFKLGVGEYAILLTGQLGKNYSLQLKNDICTIIPRKIVVKPTNCVKQYGDPDPSINYEIVEGSLFNNEKISLSFVREKDEKIGSYKLSLDSVSSANYNVTVQPSELKIVPKQLIVTGIIAANKVYDGTNKAYLFNTPVLEGIILGEDVSLLGTYSGVFVDSEAGNNKQIIVSGLTLTGRDVANYFLIAPNLIANITMRSVESENVKIVADNYSTIKNGTTLNEKVAVAKNNRGLNNVKGGLKHYPSVLATYNVVLIYGEAEYRSQGVFSVELVIPQKFMKIYNLKVSALDSEGKAVMLDAVRVDNKLVVKTEGEYTNFAIVTTNNSWEVWTVIVLSILSLFSVCFVLARQYVKKKRHIAKLNNSAVNNEK